MAISASAFSDNVYGLTINVLNVKGASVALTIRKMSTLKTAEWNRNVPVLYPKFPFQTGLTPQIVSSGSLPLTEWTWTANYYYAHAEAGAGRSATDHTDKIAQNAQTIVAAIQAAAYSLGVKYVEAGIVSEPMLVPSPDNKHDNKQFYGCEIQIVVHDWTNNT